MHVITPLKPNTSRKGRWSAVCWMMVIFLGLSLAYWIIKDHGGSIQAGGSPGQGATFTVRLPTRRGSDAGSAAAPAAAPGAAAAAVPVAPAAPVAAEAAQEGPGG